MKRLHDKVLQYFVPDKGIEAGSSPPGPVPKDLAGLIYQAQVLYRDRLNALGHAEDAGNLPWEQSRIEAAVKEKGYHSQDAPGRIVNAYMAAIREEVEMSYIVSRTADLAGFSTDAVRKYLKVYGLIPEQGKMGGSRPPKDRSYSEREIILLKEAHQRCGGSLSDIRTYLRTRWPESKDSHGTKAPPSPYLIRKFFEGIGMPLTKHYRRLHREAADAVPRRRSG